MNYTLEEIRKHKNKLYDLSNKLINTFDINQEIMINNEIKYEVECLLSLLYIKKNEINNSNNQNNMNCIISNNFQQMNKQQISFEQQRLMMEQFKQMALAQQQIMPQQQEMKQAQMNSILNNKQNINENKFNQNYISIIFNLQSDYGRNNQLTILCYPDDKVSDIIEKFRNKANVHDDNRRFIYNAKELNPSLSLAEAGLIHESIIYVVKKSDFI